MRNVSATILSELDYLPVLSYISRHGEALHTNQSMNGILNRLLHNRGHRLPDPPTHPVHARRTRVNRPGSPRPRNRLSNLIEEIRVTGKQNAEKALIRIACFDEVQQAVHKSFNRHAVYSMEGVMAKPKGACLVKKSV